jgi:hypothetical protein
MGDLGFVKTLGTLGKILSADMYDKYKNDRKVIDEISDVIRKEEEQFEKLIQYEDKIHSTVLPMICAIGSDLQRVGSSLGSKSEVALFVTRWREQATLKDLKLQLREFTKGFKIQESLTRSIEKLDETMTTLISIYDRIQSYTEQKKLADYIANIASANSLNIHIPDTVLRRSVMAFERTIISNILFYHYESVVAALKQWVFPFAELWLQDFKLTSYRTWNGSYEDSVSIISGQIQTLKSKLTEHKTSIIKGTLSNIHSADFHSSYKSGKPFYTWQNNRYKDAILDLLAGKEVVLKADVLNAVKRNAVKFNTIEIHFKSANKTIQEEANAVLSYFHVRLTHHGNSYYRCGTNLYVIRGDTQTIEYSGEKKHNGEPVDYNFVYRKLKDGDLMLSPYAMWSISLVNVTHVNFPELEKFGQHVDLELAGRGQYVAQNADVCNNVLKMFYEPENSISEFDNFV